MFVKINKNTGVFLICLLSLLLAQNASASAKRIDVLNQVVKLFNEKQYHEAISIAEKAIHQSNNCNDSIWAELKNRIALCHNRLWSNNSDKTGNDKALQHLKEALNGYTPSRNDKLIYLISDNFCRLYMISSSSILIHPTERHKDFGEVFNRSAKLLISDKINLDNASNYYVFSLREYYSEIVDKNKLDSIWENEVSPFLKSQNLSDKYYYNIKSEFYSEVYPYSRPIEAKIEQIVALLSIPGLERDYEKLANLFYDMGYYSVAAYCFENSINEKYYLEYANGEISLNPYIDNNYYIGCLEKLGKKSKIIEICDKVIADTKFPKLSKYSQEYIEKIKQEAEGVKSQKITKDTTSDSIENNNDEIDFENINTINIESLDHRTLANLLISLHKQNKLDSKTLKALLGGDIYVKCRDIFSYLYNSKNEYKLITYIYEFLRKHNKLECFEEERYYWHGAVFAPHTRHFYDIVGWSYYNIGDFENAVKCQKHELDIVRTDLKIFDDGSYSIEPSERLEFLNSRSFSRDWYIETEIYQYIDLGYLYLLIEQYESAYNMFKYAYDLNSELLQHSLIGSADEKQKIWDTRRETMLDIYLKIYNHSDKYPMFSDLITEISATIKGFMLNFNLQTRNSIKAQQHNIQALNSIVTQKQYTEKLLEVLYNKYTLDSYPYYNSSNLIKKELNRLIDSSEANIDSYDLVIRKYIDSRAIIRNSFVKIDSIKSNLRSDDVYVDFTLFCYDITSDSIKKELDREVLLDADTGKELRISLVETYHDLKIFASVMRKNWEHPQIIFLGNLFDLIHEENNDIFDIVYFHDNKREYFNKLYKNPDITKSIWGKIISVADIQPGENIHFVTNNIFNNIAIESMAVNSDTIMSDMYNMYRLSSVRELNKKAISYSPSDKCVAFGFVDYGTTIHEDIRDSKYPEILNRSKLQKLVSTAEEMDLVKDLIPTTERKWGWNANEYEFSKLSEKSPEILFFSTHGFNYDPSRLEQKESEYLYGDPTLRNIDDLSYETKSMYCSGMYLSMTNSNYTYDFRTYFASNGMLTAKEVSLYDFSNTNLAILSACSTGLGGESHEGILGLQRGFKLAGVGSIIATLWDIDENASKLLISEFLKNYTSGMSKHESLKNAQLFVRNYRSDDIFAPISFANPYYWAGFILID